MAIFSFSRIVVYITVLFMAYWAYNMYKITVTTSCKQGHNCIKPLYPLRKKMKVRKRFSLSACTEFTVLNSVLIHSSQCMCLQRKMPAA